jgi:hypothetical protein
LAPSAPLQRDRGRVYDQAITWQEDRLGLDGWQEMEPTDTDAFFPIAGRRRQTRGTYDDHNCQAELD